MFNTNLIRKSYVFLSALIFILSVSILTGHVQSAGNTPVTIRFVQISDTHFNPSSQRTSVRMVKYSKNLLDDAIDQINHIPGTDFVIFTGDLSDGPGAKLHSLFALTANNLNIPWYWTTGNHDLPQPGSRQIRNDFLLLMNKDNRYIQPEQTCYSFSKGGVLFFAMDGTNDSAVTSKGLFSRECLGFLDSALAANSDMPAVIFQHFPIVYPLKSDSHEVINQAEYFRIIDRRPNVKALFSGHYHVEKIQNRNGVLHVSTAALVQSPHSFRYVTLTRTGGDLKIDIKTIRTRLKMSGK